MFEIYQSPKNKQFYFRLKARNHQVILASEGYKTKASCKNGIKSVQKNATSESSFQPEGGEERKVLLHAGCEERRGDRIQPDVCQQGHAPQGDQERDGERAFGGGQRGECLAGHDRRR